MIYDFTFDNFRSYKNEATIDFIAKSINEFESLLIDVKGDISLLPVCAVYGPNGGGKSSVLMALYSLRDIVIEPIIQLAYMKNKNEQLGETTITQLKEGLVDRHTVSTFYKWDEEGKKRPTNYSILFQMGNSKYRYEISHHNDLIQEENLYLETADEVEVIFERDEEGVYLCDELDGLDIKNMNESLPLLSYISMFKNWEIIDRAMSFFLQIRVMKEEWENVINKIRIG